jgi:hypothetical protein
MSNAKVQISNEIQRSSEMPKQVRHDEGVILNSFQNPILNVDIHLTFACPPQAGISILIFPQIKIVVRPFSQLLETTFQKDSFLLEVGPVPMWIHLDRFSPDEHPL